MKPLKKLPKQPEVNIERARDTADNAHAYGNVAVAMIGDLTGSTANVPDGKCDIRDIALIALHFAHSPPNGHSLGAPGYVACFNCDITGPIKGVPDGKIDIRDIATAAKEFGKIDP